MRLPFHRLIAALAVATPLATLAVPPEACSLISLDELNLIADGVAAKVIPQKSGNPSSCGYNDGKHTAVLVVSVREVQYAAENELQYERENNEKIYRAKAKMIEGVGDRSFWLQPNKLLMFRKGKMLVSVTFARPKNANEVDSIKAAHVIESHMK
jgi:hypothetical protein